MAGGELPALANLHSGNAKDSTVMMVSLGAAPANDQEGTGLGLVMTRQLANLYLANLLLVENLIARRPDLRLLSARDGISGVDIARPCLPDVILVDINSSRNRRHQGIRKLQVPATADIPGNSGPLQMRNQHDHYRVRHFQRQRSDC